MCESDTMGKNETKNIIISREICACFSHLQQQYHTRVKLMPSSSHLEMTINKQKIKNFFWFLDLSQFVFLFRHKSRHKCFECISFVQFVFCDFQFTSECGCHFFSGHFFRQFVILVWLVFVNLLFDHRCQLMDSKRIRWLWAETVYWNWIAIFIKWVSSYWLWRVG